MVKPSAIIMSYNTAKKYLEFHYPSGSVVNAVALLTCIELASFPGSSALKCEIEVVHAERAWYFFSREHPQR